MSDIVERARIALQEVGVRVSELEGEIERLRGVLADIKCGAVNITMAKQMAERALEQVRKG